MAFQLLEAQQSLAFWRLVLGLCDQPAEVLPAGLGGDEEGEGGFITPHPPAPSPTRGEGEFFTPHPPALVPPENPPRSAGGIHSNGEGGFLTPPPNPPPRSIREGGFGFCGRGFDGEFGAEDGLEAQGLGGFLEADGAVDVVVIGQGQPGHTQARRFRQQGFGRCRAAQQAVGGMGVEFDVVGHGFFLTTEARK